MNGWIIEGYIWYVSLLSQTRVFEFGADPERGETGTCDASDSQVRETPLKLKAEGEKLPEGSLLPLVSNVDPILGFRAKN